MNNLIFMPILLPLLTGIILIFLSRRLMAQRIVSLTSSICAIGLACWIVSRTASHGVLTVAAGSWEAPFGIVLTADMLASLLVLTTSLIGFAVILYSFQGIGKERESYYYYSLVQFLLTGVNGAFLTGDLFNLFVFFEVMLMASYVLLVLGGTKGQLKETIKYLLVNVIASALFVITVAYLYSVTGTLNMADLSRRIAYINQPGIITVTAVSFFIVFGMKGAVFPLFHWMPGSYASPPAPVMALFGSLLTKVGIYSLFRTYTLLFYHDQGYTHTLLGVLGLLTILAGMAGAAGSWNVKQIIIYNIIIAIGVLVFGISLMNEKALSGTIFYLIHDMIIKAALFLLIGIVIKVTGTSNLRKMGGLIRTRPLLGWSYFIAAVSLAGIPPFSGFTGKWLILQGAARESSFIGFAIILLSSFVVLYSVMKIFIHAFWGEAPADGNEKPARYPAMMIPAAALTAVSVAYGLGAEFMYPFISQAADTLLHPDIYINAVLKE